LIFSHETSPAEKCDGDFIQKKSIVSNIVDKIYFILVNKKKRRILKKNISSG
jgi:hypothetical protein